jgi:hypothetical protein
VDETRALPKEIEDRFTDWDQMALKLRVVSTCLGLIAIVCSILVASDIGELADGWRRGLAITTAIATALLTGLGLTSKSNNTRAAWRLMNAARLRYVERVVENDRQAMSDLIDAYERAESMIGDITISV